MGFNGVLKFIVIFSLFVISIDAYFKYDILFRDEEIYSHCENPNFNLLEEYIDKTNLFFEYMNDGSVYIHGECEFIKDVGTENNPLRLEVFKKSRGEWVNTVYTIIRKDFCAAMFDPTEFWYMYFKEIDDKSCPYKNGKIFNVNSSSILSLILPDPRLEGDFKIQILVHFKGINETLCMNILAELYKVPYLG